MPPARARPGRRARRQRGRTCVDSSETARDGPALYPRSSAAFAKTLRRARAQKPPHLDDVARVAARGGLADESLEVRRGLLAAALVVENRPQVVQRVEHPRIELERAPPLGDCVLRALLAKVDGRKHVVRGCQPWIEL